MSDNDITITVDGQTLSARKGQMLIEVTDEAGIDIPRFCYHKKLSVAANCRMCLVEVEKAPKPLPACATPVMPDMVVKTQSKVALAAQKGTMEFLLINHPLDCPICDQGGECELQDVAMGYGSSASQYTEGKRVVLDKYVGPLIATEMTRCIHCTRCVRFGEEIAGVRELGATGRGEDTRIGTYIEKSISSEVSGNVIDVCPVGALTARPSRFSARAWELTQVPSVAQHDCVGSNIFIHLDNGEINRVVPRDNESINEVWISDRDRFSYQGLNSADRLTRPLVRVDGELREASWDEALTRAADILSGAAKANKLGTLVSPNSTLEELYLSQKLVRGLGSSNIDHRLSQADFDGCYLAPVMPWLGMSFADLENQKSTLVVGSNIRKDQPIAALRLRKSSLKGGAVNLINPMNFPLHFDATVNRVCRSDAMVRELIAVAQAAGADLGGLDDVPAVDIQDAHRSIADSLKQGENSVVLAGNLAMQHPQASEILILCRAIASATDSLLSLLTDSSNSAGAWLAGCVPHRTAAGGKADQAGMNAAAMLNEPMDAYLLFGVEPAHDSNNPGQTLSALKRAGDVVVIGAYNSDAVSNTATVVLPAAISYEQFGTYVNAAGVWQSTRGQTSPKGEARPGWKILRALGDLLEVDGTAFEHPDEISAELQRLCGAVELNNFKAVGESGSNGRFKVRSTHHNGALLRQGDFPIYASDAIVRRAEALQKTDDARLQHFARLCRSEADARGVADGDQITVTQSLTDGSEVSSVMTVKADETIPAGAIWIAGGTAESADLGALNGEVEVSKA